MEEDRGFQKAPACTFPLARGSLVRRVCHLQEQAVSECDWGYFRLGIFLARCQLAACATRVVSGQSVCHMGATLQDLDSLLLGAARLKKKFAIGRVI